MIRCLILDLIRQPLIWSKRKKYCFILWRHLRRVIKWCPCDTIVIIVTSSWLVWHLYDSFPWCVTSTCITSTSSTYGGTSACSTYMNWRQVSEWDGEEASRWEEGRREVFSQSAVSGWLTWSDCGWTFEVVYGAHHLEAACFLQLRIGRGAKTT